MQKRSVPENVAERAEYKFARRGCFKDKRHPRPRGISHNSNLNIRYTRTYIRYPWPSPLYIKANPLDKNERSQLLIIEPIHQKSQYDRCLSVRTKFPLCVWIILRIKFPPIRYLLLRPPPSFRSFPTKRKIASFHELLFSTEYIILDIRFVSKFYILQVELSR